MSHTFKFAGWRFHYDSDLGGHVTIANDERGLDVPAEALIRFVADVVRRERVAEVEAMSPAELFGVPGRSGPRARRDAFGAFDGPAGLGL